MSFNTTKVTSTASSNVNSNTFDGAGTAITSSLVSAKQGLDVNIINSSTSVSGVVDNTSFIYGNGVEQPIGGVYQDTAPTLTAGNTGAVRLTQYRGFHVNLRDSSGTELGTSTPLTISGTVTANQGGTWNINNISGTVSLPTGAATEASLAKLTLTQGSTTSGQSGTLALGAVTTAAPSYTTAQTNSLSLTTSGALRVDGSASTQPISGTVTANQGGTWNIGTVTTITNAVTVSQATAANLNATVVGTGTFAVQAAQSGTWNINNISGTISLPTGAATESSLAKLTQTQGSTTSGQSGPLVLGAVTTAAPTYTTAQSSPLSLTTAGALRVDASASTQPISGTVTANQGGAPWSFNQTQVNGVAVSTGNGVTGTGVQRVTISSDNTAFSVNAIQSGSWTVTANAGTNLNTSALALDTSVNGILLAQASTTSGQTGPLIQGAVTTAAPTYTTAKTNPLSLTTAGALRVDGSGSTQPISGTVAATQSGTWNIATVTAVTAITNALPTGANIIGSLTANQSVNVAQINGVTPLMGNGVTGTGSQRVTIASDNTAFSVNAIQSGTWTVQPGNTANTTPWLVTSNVGTTGGMTRFRNTALSNTATAVKASAGNLYYYHVYNVNTADAFLQVYNVAAGSVTVGTTTPDLTFAIPAGGVLDGSFDGSPFSFDTAITIAATTTITGGTAPSTGLLVAIGYK